MNVSEFVGLIITILVLFTAMARRLWEEKQRRDNPEEYEEKLERDKEAFQAFLRSLDIEVEGEQKKKKRMPPPPPSVKEEPEASQPMGHYVPSSTVAENFEFHSQLEERHRETSIEKRQLTSSLSQQTGRDLVSDTLKQKEAFVAKGRKRGASRSRDLVLNRPSKKEMVILHEVLGPPKGFSF